MRNTLENGAGEPIGKAALHITANFTLHNHPTGDLTPSREDIEITRRLREAGDILGIKVVDHIIIDTETGRSNSFVSSGLM